MNLYIDYSEFELTCWNTDGKGTNVAIPLTEEQAKKICDIIGLLSKRAGKPLLFVVQPSLRSGNDRYVITSGGCPKM